MRITCLVDNSAEHATALWAEHGSSYMIETSQGKVLFDTGQSGTVLMHNLQELKEKPRDFTAVVLSHGHYDHTGGLRAFLKEVPGLPVYGHSAVLDDHRAMRKKKPPKSIGIPMKPRELDKKARLRLSAKPQEVLRGLWTTGGVTKRLEPEGRSARHVVRKDGAYISDPYLDDLSLIWKGRDGLVVLLGCAHAGVLNVLAHARDMFHEPIAVVIGGMHLHRADEKVLDHIVEVLGQEYPDVRLYPNHCSGVAGFLALSRAFGSAVHPCPAGTVLEF